MYTVAPDEFGTTTPLEKNGVDFLNTRILQGLHLQLNWLMPNPRVSAPCPHADPSTLDYSKNAKHIQDLHMSYYETGIFNRKKSQYLINTKTPDMNAMWDLVKSWNAYVFVYAHDAYWSGGNAVFTDAIPPHLIPTSSNQLFGGLFIGVDSTKVLWLLPYTYPTIQDTLVVASDCKTVQTSHPGPPRPGQ